MKRATIKDIGLLVGVNPSTVSRALRNHQDISVELKQKIKEVAEQLKYVPNETAVNLRNRESKIIGLIIPSITMFFTPSVINGISEKLQTGGYKLMVLCSQESIEQEIENIKICCNAGVDGILISLSNQTKDLEHLQLAYELEIPIVLFDKTVKQDLFDEVIIDNAKAASLCAEYLLSKDCKNILAVYGNQNLGISKEREKAFTSALQKNNITVAKNIFAESSNDAKLNTIEYLLANNTIDGVFAMSDEVMIGVHVAIQKTIGDKCNMVAISDGKLPAYFHPPISYLRHDGFKLGEKATAILLQHIQDTFSNTKNQKYYLDVEMMYL